ncbi:MAG TPA: hypothetical protein VGK51_07585 [Actinomycetota bacterium]
MRSTRGPGVFPATLPEQLTHILTSMNVDLAGNPAGPFIDDNWRLQACQFVNGDPSRLEVIFTGILGGRVRLTLSAKKLGQGWFEAGEIWGDGDPALTPIAKKLSSLVQETVEPNQPDVSLDLDLIKMRPSRI